MQIEKIHSKTGFKRMMKNIANRLVRCKIVFQRMASRRKQVSCNMIRVTRTVLLKNNRPLLSINFSFKLVYQNGNSPSARPPQYIQVIHLK